MAQSEYVPGLNSTLDSVVPTVENTTKGRLLKDTMVESLLQKFLKRIKHENIEKTATLDNGRFILDALAKHHQAAAQTAPLTDRLPHLFRATMAMRKSESLTKKFGPIAADKVTATLPNFSVTQKIKPLVQKGNRPKPVHGLFNQIGSKLKSFISGSPEIAKAAEAMYKHAALKGGLAEKAGKTEKDFDPKALAMGAKVEAEHTSNKSLRKEIAMDHLTEDPKYYIKLKKMEKKSALEGRYRNATAGVTVARPADYAEAFEKEDDKMTEYMHNLLKHAVLSTGNSEASAVGRELTELEVNNNAWRKYKNMTGLASGTDWGYMQKKAVQSLTLESEDPKFMERDYQARPQKGRWLREVANNNSINNEPLGM